MAERAVVAFGANTRWDERRNSSAVLPVPPDALPNALRALAAFRRDQPALYAWVAAGAPRLSEAEHLARFGEPYRKGCARAETLR
jgi:hypothetical protein